MCELFGVSSPEKLVLNDLLKELFSHGKDHPHGWGMAFFYRGSVSLEKQPEPSHESKYLKQRLRSKIEAAEMMAHIRYATKGTMDYENTHPFVLRDLSDRAWTLIHNGTIFDCNALNKYVFRQDGSTDSERILLYLIDKINEAMRKKGSELSSAERFEIVDAVIHVIAPENKVNLLLYDGELLYAHTNLKDTLHVCQKGDASILSTVPLDQDEWKDVPLNTLVAYEKGQCRFVGKKHPYEFFEDEEKYRWLYLDYASL